MDFLDENVSFKDEDDFKKQIKEKFKLLKELVLDEFDKPQIETTTPITSVEKATEQQKKYLVDLGYTNSNLNDLTKIEARELISDLLNARQGGY